MKYSTPYIPNTPSPKVNRFLESRFSQPPDNIVKSLAAHYVCAVFYSINALYEALRQLRFFAETDDKTYDGPHRAWLIACGLVPMILALSCYLIYKTIMAGSFIVEMILAYGLASFAWIALVTGICGAVCYEGKQRVRLDGTAQSLSERNLGYEPGIKDH